MMHFRQLTEESTMAAKLRTGKRCPKDLRTMRDCIDAM